MSLSRALAICRHKPSRKRSEAIRTSELSVIKQFLKLPYRSQAAAGGPKGSQIKSPRVHLDRGALRPTETGCCYAPHIPPLCRPLHKYGKTPIGRGSYIPKLLFLLSCPLSLTSTSNPLIITSEKSINYRLQATVIVVAKIFLFYHKSNLRFLNSLGGLKYPFRYLNLNFLLDCLMKLWPGVTYRGNPLNIRAMCYI